MMGKVVFKQDKSTIYHWFGYWLGVFFLAYLFQYSGYLISILLGLIGSLVFWLFKEIIWDGWFRKQPINLADIIGGWLFFYVFKELIKTQTR